MSELRQDEKEIIVKDKLILENIFDLIEILNSNLEIEYLNEGAHLRLLNYSHNELIGRCLEDFLPTMDFESLKTKLKNISIKEERGIFYQMCHKDGHYIWFEADFKEIEDSDGIKKILMISRDMNKQLNTHQSLKEAEKELKKSEDRFKRVFEAIPDLFFIISKDGVILYFKGKENDLYVPPEEILGKKMTKILPPELAKRTSNAIKKTLETRNPQIIEYNLPIQGETRFFEARHLYYSKDQVAIFVREITDRKMAENIIKEEIKKLKELDDLRQNLITRVSHELKTPLATITAASEFLIRDSNNQIGSESLELLTMIERGSHKLKKLVDKLIDISKIELDKLILEKHDTDLSELVNEVASDMMYLINERKLNLRLSLSKKLIVSIDRLRFEQVLTNLLSNAIKNTPPNEGIIKISLKEENGSALITVSDNGVGLTKEELDKLFTRFGKYERYGEGLEFLNIQGSGLGLYISKEIVELHEGQIEAESSGRHQGATFIVRLPMK